MADMQSLDFITYWDSLFRTDLRVVHTEGPKMKAFEYTVRGNSQESYALCSFLLSIKGFIHKLSAIQ